MTHVTCRLTAKNQDQLWNPALGNRVRAIFFLPFNNNNNHDNVCGAIVMTKVIARGHSVYFDECRLSAGWPPTLRPSQSTWAVSLPKTACYHPHPPSPQSVISTHFTVPRRVEGCVDLGTAVKVRNPCPRLYIATAVAINTTFRGAIRTLVLSHRSQTR